MKKLEQKKEGVISDLDNMPEDALVHENGVWYRELKIDGLDEKVKLFNSLKPQRLEGETSVEYKIRRSLVKQKNKTKHLFYNPYADPIIEEVKMRNPVGQEVVVGSIKKPRPYVNHNKKDKFKKKK